MAKPSFVTPRIDINTAHWGPTILPEQYIDVPYAPFGKSDRLGKAADFNAHFQNRRWVKGDPSGVNNEFQYKYDVQEDASFQLVDTAKAKNPRTANRIRAWTSRNPRPLPRRNGGRTGNNQGGQSHLRTGQRPQQQQNKRWDKLNTARRQYGSRRRDDHKTERAASVKVNADWELLTQFDLAQLTKLQTNVPTSETLRRCGQLYQYDDTYDRITAKNERQLTRYDNREFFYITTTDDPVIQELAEEGQAQVFATDAILAQLMASSRSIYPWDIVVQKVENVIFFDKRENSNFDLVTVNETSNDPPSTEDPNSINHPDRLATEASMINQNFTQQILNESIVTDFEEPHPFFEGDEENAKTPAYAYLYRKWSLGDNLQVIARCELHGTMMKKNIKSYITAYALNEWDPKLAGSIDWRQKIDHQRGAVLGNELKNNSCKLAKWTAQALLAGADVMKLGYVSRSKSNSPYSHVILGTHSYKPPEFAQQIAFTQNNMWGIIKMFVDLFKEQSDGKYVILKDPNKPIVKVFSVPATTFEEDSQEE